MALSAGHSSTFLGGSALSQRSRNRPGAAQARQGLVVRCGESRIGKLPVTVPSNVNVDLKGQYLKVKVRRTKRTDASRWNTQAVVEMAGLGGRQTASDVRTEVGCDVLPSPCPLPSPSAGDDLCRRSKTSPFQQADGDSAFEWNDGTRPLHGGFTG